MLDILKRWLAVQQQYDAAIAARDQAIEMAKSLEGSLGKLTDEIRAGDFGVSRYKAERFVTIDGFVVRLCWHDNLKTTAQIVKVEMLAEPEPVPADVVAHEQILDSGGNVKTRVQR